ncbi:unnamed protein product [Pleuronectes platessa]|uniref:Uncharacterized protein n=1 Tax=Pleuronectes platessa TaxID=8262 RepID=A0A9N7YTE5_PLEPL|nr:unnamed protein product [Pleuronectes platessa]
MLYVLPEPGCHEHGVDGRYPGTLQIDPTEETQVFGDTRKKFTSFFQTLLRPVFPVKLRGGIIQPVLGAPPLGFVSPPPDLEYQVAEFEQARLNASYHKKDADMGTGLTWLGKLSDVRLFIAFNLLESKDVLRAVSNLRHINANRLALATSQH